MEILCETGSMISIAYAYPDYAIDAIAVKEGDIYDKETWNIYARWYPRLNDALNETVKKLAEEADGIPIPATITGEALKVNHVEEYYGMVVSHRVVAEHAGIGWRGKNELVINPRYSCAIRLASVATPLPLEPTTTQYAGCGDCRSCLNECPFLRNKETLENFREHCRRFMLGLGLEDFVCGICIKACANSPVFNTPREMITRKPENPIYYIN